ncbi:MULTISPECIES: hypothetical protein [Streptomyces]|uniref:Extradiol ring-cleavage dioxygenase LigAB LigA subunit domain-containing protein n=1 Tax=Streptomyces cacaoi TaxID=1898 RepID=A0A4Y3QVK1_STRCI|nr:MULTISPECIES: hypothetical protein [Streptomyces]NNG83393.1 hypothetical protein [Streptomyces cacaoi]QHF95393.1 hypothetical protein DEH18_17685 [Streptomyces sp. NHF165]GEB49271.1 hypothetical protein SCA03_18220 [Streptomyces cacaoi]
MSVHEINRLCYRASHDPEYLAALRAEPGRQLALLDLEPEERRELLSGDVLALYHRGVHPVLLVRLGTHRLLGLTPELYARRITADRDAPPPS